MGDSIDGRLWKIAAIDGPIDQLYHNGNSMSAGERPMVLLTKLDSTKILVPLSSIKYLEAVPDTLIFFLNGDTVMVRESLDQIAQAAIAPKAEQERP